MRIISKVESFYTIEILDLSHLKLLRSAEQNVIFIFKMPSNVQKLSRPSVCHQVVSLKAEKTNQDPCNPLLPGSSEWSKSCILERRFKSIVYICWNTPNFPSLKSWMQSMRHQKITHFLMDRACTSWLVIIIICPNISEAKQDLGFW